MIKIIIQYTIWMGRIIQPTEIRIKNKIIKWARIIHRDVGFLMVGICLVYAISGILLNHMNGADPAFRTEEATIQFSPNLSREELTIAWNDKKDIPTLNKILLLDEDHLRLMLDGGIGVYNKINGSVDYEKYTKREFIYWINKLHYNKVKGWSIMGDLFAGSLIFFALSGLIMVRGKNGILGRGKWYLAIGLFIPILYIILA